MNKIDSTLVEIEQKLNELTKRDLTQNLAAKSEPAVAELGDNLEILRGKLIRFILEIAGNSYALGDSTNELLDVSADMQSKTLRMEQNTANVLHAAQSVTEAIHTVSAAAEELSVNMASVSETAAGASQSVEVVSESANQLNEAILNIANRAETSRGIVYNAINKINDVETKMQELAKNAKGINHITTTISNITNQTRLLSLNATIEAARAQEAGGRFAVVASEVKTLAAKISDATDDIYKKIDGVQKASAVAVSSFLEIGKVMHKVDDYVSTIAVAVEEQSAVTNEIANNINHVSVSISQTAEKVSAAYNKGQMVTKNLAEGAQLSSDILQAVGSIKEKTGQLREDAVNIYASAMEVSARGYDLDRIVKTVKLPLGITAQKHAGELFKFSEIYSVKVNDLDNEHIGIFNYINQIHTAIKNRNPESEILALLKKLNAWTINHFAHEEELMISINYENYDAQKKSHTKLLADIKENIIKMENKEDVNFIALLVFLKDWLKNHILGMDKDYSALMNKKGIK